MSIKPNILTRQLEELHLLRCSLLPGEFMVFDPVSEEWSISLDTYSEGLGFDASQNQVLSPACFQIKTQESRIWFDVKLPATYHGYTAELITLPAVSVRGDELGRSDQEEWQTLIKDTLKDLADSEYPIYELISTHLLPRLHALHDARPPPGLNTDPSAPRSREGLLDSDEPPYHALLTSHHLISPNKRRALHQWSTALALHGFAKVGYPGVIYAEGARSDVEEFVRRVRDMQWLALRVRFVEAVPASQNQSLVGKETESGARWVEFEKVGEVVEEMRRLARESFVLEMGIGSAGAANVAGK